MCLESIWDVFGKVWKALDLLGKYLRNWMCRKPFRILRKTLGNVGNGWEQLGNVWKHVWTCWDKLRRYGKKGA